MSQEAKAARRKAIVIVGQLANLIGALYHNDETRDYLKDESPMVTKFQ
jgi:hypothetical protein